MLFKKLIRTALNYKAQFISMIIMVGIGMGVFMGFNMEWYSLEQNLEKFVEETKYADYRIYSEEGFSKEEIKAISNIDGVDAASRVLAVNVDIKDNEDSLSMFVLEDYVVSIMKIMDGAEYDSEKSGIWLSDKYAESNNVKIGDELCLVYMGAEIKGEVVGLVKSMEYQICVADENQLMPDSETFGFAYISPKLVQESLEQVFYPQINILSDLSKEELEDEIKNAIGKTTLVTTKDEHMSYAGCLSEIEEGQTMGALLPILFLSIAMLTMVTTMHRIAANEKIQIGTMKALGFRDSRILRHYTSYGFVIGVVGGVIAVALGYLIVAIVVDKDGMMGTYLDTPYWETHIPPICFIVLGLSIVLQTFICFLSIKKMLVGTAAETLRPYRPKKMKAMKIEKTKMWQKLSFANKWNIRDVLRHKSRSIMTLIGIFGCMLLLVGGLGMKDTMGEFFDLIDEEINNYTTKVNMIETSDNEEVSKFAEKYNGDWQAQTSIKVDNKAIALDIYNINNDKIHFINEDNERVKLSDDGAYICIRLSEKYDIGDTIEFSPYGSEETYKVKVAGVIRSIMTENITITKEYADKIGIPYHIGSVYTDFEANDIEDAKFIAGKQSKKAIMDSYDEFMEIMNIMVAIFVVGAIVIGIVVLYNLGVMSYVERSRELATLKVVGFRDKHIGNILVSQNVWLTVIGVIIGLPAGYGVLYALVMSLISEYELSITIGPFTYLVSILVTFGVSMIVGLFVAKKNKDIDMVEALKDRE